MSLLKVIGSLDEIKTLSYNVIFFISILQYKISLVSCSLLMGLKSGQEGNSSNPTNHSKHLLHPLPAPLKP